jgi:hypothetical protein
VPSPGLGGGTRTDKFFGSFFKKEPLPSANRFFMVRNDAAPPPSGAAIMYDPCHPHPHRRHGPAHSLGRIHRHGTKRLAKSLHAHTGGCLPGPKILLGSALLKIGLPAAAFIALAAVAPTLLIPTDPGRPTGPGPVTVGVPPPPPLGSTPVPPHKPGHRPVAPIAEPASWTLLLLAAAACAGLRRCL